LVHVFPDVKKKPLKFYQMKNTPKKMEAPVGEIVDSLNGASELWNDQARIILSRWDEDNDPDTAPTAKEIETTVGSEAPVSLKAAWDFSESHDRGEHADQYIHVYVWWELPVVGEARIQSNIIHVDGKQLSNWVLAHELGHSFGITGDYPGIGLRKEALMSYSESGHVNRIHVDEAKKARVKNED